MLYKINFLIYFPRISIQYGYIGLNRQCAVSSDFFLYFELSIAFLDYVCMIGNYHTQAKVSSFLTAIFFFRSMPTLSRNLNLTLNQISKKIDEVHDNQQYPLRPSTFFTLTVPFRIEVKKSQ